MPDEANIQRVLSYVEQHRDRYPLDSLRQQLLAAGYSADDIDAAFARLDQPPASPETTVLPTEQAAPTVVLAGLTDEPPQESTPPDTTAELLASAEDERAIQQMVSYLHEHGSQYTSEALRGQLLAAGQRPELVEQAMAQAQVAEPRLKEPPAWPLGLLVAAINIFALPIVLASLGSAVGAISDTLTTILGLLPVLALLGELVAGIVLLRGPRRRLGKALLWGLLFSIVIPLILALLLLGICLVIIFGAGGGGNIFR